MLVLNMALLIKHLYLTVLQCMSSCDMMSPLLSALLLLLLTSSASPSAPSDFDTNCTQDIETDNSARVLVDTYNYVDLPWTSVDMDGDNTTVSGWNFYTE